MTSKGAWRDSGPATPSFSAGTGPAEGVRGRVTRRMPSSRPQFVRGGHREPMESIAHCIRRSGLFLRRRDLLARGYSDAAIRHALAARQIFRVRQGWYSIPRAPDHAVRAVRVGGRLTGVSALESYGLRVPRRDRVHIAVPENACRLRRPADRHQALRAEDGVRVHWIDSRRERHASPWRVPVDDALLAVLVLEPRDVAVACASAVMRAKRWSRARLHAVFARAPERVRCWQALVSELDESHGETFVRLWFHDAGIWFEQQPEVEGVGRLDFRLSPNVFVEVDGAQHDPGWTGEGGSTYEHDRDRDAALAARNGRALRWTYRQLYSRWPQCLAALETAVADDLELIARRLRHPRPPRALAPLRRQHGLQKRRRSTANGPPTEVSRP